MHLPMLLTDLADFELYAAQKVLVSIGHIPCFLDISLKIYLCANPLGRNQTLL